uniref:Uncharacterized protein n=1 Tax=Solanum lycopersicum TaxID=4081 RepID=A0A494G8X0_SOLLC
MPRSTLSDQAAQGRLLHVTPDITVCASQGPCWHATPNVVRPCVLSKGDDGMPDPMSFVSVFCQMVKIACHA